MLSDSSILHHAVNVLLADLLAGSLIWLWLYTRGLLARAYAEHGSRGGPVGALARGLLTLLVIIYWPVAVFVFAIDGERA
jgi:hypothetical protein